MQFSIPFLIYDLKAYENMKGSKLYRGVVRDAAKRAYLRTRCAEAQQWRCCYCQVKMTTNRNHRLCATLEHVLPVSKGGEDTYENCVAACKMCNNKRGNADLTEDMRLPQKVTEKKPFAGLDRKIRRAKVMIEQGGCFDTWYASVRLSESFKEEFKAMLAKEMGVA